MDAKLLYPYTGIGTAIHKKTLCGISPPRAWESAFEGQAFPEIGKFEPINAATMGEGFWVGHSFAGDYVFCKRCYAAMKRIRGV